MNIYYLMWTILLGVGLLTSVSLFIWAIRQGQFREHERARYLPLRGEAPPETISPKSGARIEICIALSIITIGISGIIFVILIIMCKTPGVIQ